MHLHSYLPFACITPHKTRSHSRSDTSTEPDQLEHVLEPPFATMALVPLRHTSSKAKSSLCKNFTEKGYCPYGNKCQFAHGPEQLRINMETNRSYKTKGCHTFAKKGFCCFGDRCNFIHQQNDSWTDTVEKWSIIYRNHRETLRAATEDQGSRLLNLLGCPEDL